MRQAQDSGMAKVAVVTGAGSGVGRSVVLRLRAEGWRVALLGRRAEPLRQTIEMSDGAEKAIAIPCDIAIEAHVIAMAAQVERELGDVDALVNSAGINVSRRSLEQLSVEDYRRIMDVDLTGAFLCAHAFLPSMRRRRTGTIVNVISDAGLSGNRVSGAAYIAAKFGLSGLTAAINAEERKNGIRACGIYPGEINTPLLDQRPTPPPAEARAKMLQAEDVADCVMLAINLPPRAIVEQLVIRPA
jgi:NAD(P)-dependent dehydrogenase (short-subunit alcohol dehydrogenase family)